LGAAHSSAMLPRRIVLLCPLFLSCDGLLPLVRDNIKRAVIHCDVDDSLSLCSRMMKAARVTGAPVMDDNSLAGIVSRNDLLRCCADRPQDLREIGELPLYKILPRQPTTIPPSATLVEAAALMRASKLNRLLVQAQYSAVLGVVSATDVVFAMFGLGGLLDADALSSVDCSLHECVPAVTPDDSRSCVQAHMARSLNTISPTMTVADAARLLKAADVTGAPVVDPEGGLVGVLSRQDLLQALAEIRPDEDFQAQMDELGARSVASVLSRSVQTIAPETSMLEAAQVMASEKLNRLLVTNPDGGLVGLVSSTDAVFALLGDADAETNLDELLQQRLDPLASAGHAAGVY